MTADDEPLVRVAHVSKKYCRSLRRSLWYGLRDVGAELAGRPGDDRLRLRKDEFLAVDDVSFELRRGECLGLIGANGAGKSTLLKMLNGLVRPDAGRIEIRGRIGALIELGAGFNPILSGRENVYVNGAVLGMTKREVDARFDEIVEFAEIGEFIDSPVQSYSSGMRVRLGFAVAAHLEPDLLLVDEVLAVGDIGFRMKCIRRLRDFVGRGGSAIVVAHSTVELRRVSTRFLLVRQGSLQFDGEPAEAIARYQAELAARQQRSAGRPARDAPGLDPDFRVARVSMSDARGTSRDAFATGDELHFDIEIQARRPLRGARLTAQIATSGHALGAFGTPFSGFELDLAPPATTVRLVVEDCPLLIGSYDLSLALNGPGPAEMLDYREDAARFRVDAPPTDPLGFARDGIVAFRHRWERRTGASS